ncbi:extracellular metallo proteinase 1 [Xylariomycetidae sp. FL2044]|nr:extracellular metallo proteinase 1 [Xylariomycetidae sp. FL2044]
MRSLFFLSFLGAPFQARATVDLDAYRLPSRAWYSNTADVAAKPALALLKRDDYVQTATALVNQIAPNATFRVLRDHYVGTNGVAHVYFGQTANGIDIENAGINVNVGSDGNILSYGNSFFAGQLPDESPLERRDVLDAAGALDIAVSTLHLPLSGDRVAKANTESSSFQIQGTEGPIEDPDATMVYIAKADDTLALTWRVETRFEREALASYVQVDGEANVIGVLNFVSHATYEVYPWGLNNPTEGEREVLTDPWDSTASPGGWHNHTNFTPERKTTIGNNVDAGSLALSNSGLVHYPEYTDETDQLHFEFPFTPDTLSPPDTQFAALTQVFYTLNMAHDLYYILGFTPAAGNYQRVNNGEGGLEGDPVTVIIQHWSNRNNGVFTQSIDGREGRMDLYVFDHTDPYRDVSFDNGFVIHEYTHGLSDRLTGGPSTAGCLSSWEPDGMAEGWSDLFAAAIMLKPEDTRETAEYGFAAWPLDVDSPPTARLVMYTTDMEVNNFTYATLNGFAADAKPHQIGSVWTSMLYEVLWNLVDRYGKNDGPRPEMVEGVPADGKYLTLKLLVDAMAQPCNPSFIQARDAIVDADTVLTGGANLCEIWKGFAKRGLGRDAAPSDGNRVDDFTVPDGVC